MTGLLAGLNDFYRAKEDLEALKQEHPALYDHWLHVVSLTRQLQIKYGYLGSLLMEEECLECKPEFVRESVLSLYQEEVGKLKAHPEIYHVKEIIEKNRNIGDSKLFLLMLGAKPELLQGSTIIK